VKAVFVAVVLMWGGSAYDPELDYVYLATSTPTNNYYGGHRLGNNLFAESLVCLEAKTGKRVWHYQAVHHGIWDYDFPTHPILGDITVNGRRIKAVVQISKQAMHRLLKEPGSKQPAQWLAQRVAGDPYDHRDNRSG